MTSLSIAQVTHVYRPSIGGIENYVHRLTESIRDTDHEVTTYTTDLSLASDASPLGADGSVQYCDTTVSPLRNPLSVELHRRVARSDHDIYHLHSPWFLSSLFAAHAVPTDATVVMTVHSAQIRSNSALVRALNTVYDPLARYVFKKVDHSFVQGRTERERLLDRFDLASETVSIVPNGIHPEEYDMPDTVVNDFYHQHGIDPDRPVALFVSRLIPEKNPGVFVDAVTEHLEGRDVQPVIIGTGEETFVASLRERGPEVTFLSNLEFAELKSAYHASDLFVFLGTWEGLPTVVLEAMNARLPVIATPVGAIPDTVTDGENGTLVSSPPSAREVASALRTYLDNPDRREAVGRRNRGLVRESYEWDGIAETVVRTYQELTAGR